MFNNFLNNGFVVKLRYSILIFIFGIYQASDNWIYQMQKKEYDYVYEYLYKGDVKGLQKVVEKDFKSKSR